MRGLAAAGLAAAFGTALVGMAIVTSAVSFLGGADGQPSASSAATAGIPQAMLALYQEAAETCPGLPWTVLAAIGTVESDNGQSDLPGVHSGANAAGAEGPMQFEPATFAEYARPIPPGGANPPTPYDPTDAVYAASRLLCANGAAGGTDITGAIYAYNHSNAYVQKVLALAQSYAGGTAGAVDSSATTGAGVTAVQWALAQIGTPYVWGGETPGVGFDCSGLVQAAYAVAGVALPRVAQDQYDATPKLTTGTTFAPGDLVFFGSGPAGIDHVGLYVGVVDGQTVMVDAPYTGADVRAEAFPATVGASYGSLVFVGATRPA
ncbi:MAG TPA: bifunctional lytic transglycosylase/C40 family peptidase [Acidimicrobiales bacterium]|jgi:cell wall-associated NlpC family hydrolase